MVTVGQLIKLGIRGGGVPTPPPADIVVTNYAELVAAFGTDLSGKTVLVQGDCRGARVDITDQTWPGLTIQGTSLSVMGLMPRIRLNRVSGGSGAPITWKWLDFYNECTDPAESNQGIFTARDGVCAHHLFSECKIHDAPFTTKTFPWGGSGNSLVMYRGFNTEASSPSNPGRWEDLETSRCEIYNVVRSVINADGWWSHNNKWHDHYIHACTIIGSNQLIEDEECWNLWASGTDTGSPHAGNSFSPQPTGNSDCENVTIRRVVAIPGVARYNYAVSQGRPSNQYFPSASGIKFNDMYSTGFNNKNILIEDCLLVGSDNMMAEINAPLGCTIRGVTLVEDLGQRGSSNAAFVSTRGGDIKILDIITFAINPGTTQDARPFPLYPVNVANASAAATGADNLVSYEAVFVGPCAFISSLSEAIDAYTINPTHPYASWSVTPGYLGDAGRAYSTVPTTANVTSQAFSTVVKPATCFVQANPPGAPSPWVPTNKRQGGLIVRLANDAAIDLESRFVLGATGSALTLERLSGSSPLATRGNWRFALDKSGYDKVLSATGTATTLSSDGLVTIILGWDLAQAKLKMAILSGGNVLLDFGSATYIFDTDIDYAALALINFLSTVTGSTTAAWTDQVDLFGLTDTFLDLDDPAIYANVINTSGELADLGAAGANIFGSPWAIWLQGPASAWNGTNFNAGNGLDENGNPTVFNYVGTSAGQFVDA